MTNLWRVGLTVMTVALAAALGLIIALSAGWNAPGPARSPAWQMETPVRLTARAGGRAIVLLDHPAADFALEVEARPVAGPAFNGYGPIYRAQDTGRYYVFAVGGDGYYAVLRGEGETEAERVVWRQFPHIRRGRTANRLRVECSGPACRFYINDEYTTTVEGHRWSSGDIGLWVRAFDGDVTVLFDTVRLWTGQASENKRGNDDE